MRIFLFFLTLTFLFFSCKKEDDSVQAVALPNAYGEGVYILTDQDVNYIDSDNILKENIFNSVNGGSILNPKRLKIKNDKVLITGNRIYMLDINTFGLEAEVGGFINATDCDFVSFNRLFVTDRGDGYVKVVDLDNLHITNQIESGDSSRPAFIVSDYTRSFILNGGGEGSAKKDKTIISVEHRDGLVSLANFRGRVFVGDNPISAVFSDKLKVLCRGVYSSTSTSANTNPSFYVISPSANIVIDSLQILGAENVRCLVENNAGDKLFFTSEDGIYRINYSNLTYSLYRANLNKRSTTLALNFEQYANTDSTTVNVEMMYINDLDNPGFIYKYNTYLSLYTDSFQVDGNVIDIKVF